MSYEAMYTSLYAMPRGVLREQALAQLRRGYKGRRLRACSQPRRNRAIPDMVLIDQRPAEAAERLVPGHWKGDLVIGKGNRSQVVTLVERTTLFVTLVKLNDAKARSVAEGFAHIFNRVDSQLRPLADLRPGNRGGASQDVHRKDRHRGLLRSSA